jgi:hypothetical protein
MNAEETINRQISGTHPSLKGRARVFCCLLIIATFT